MSLSINRHAFDWLVADFLPNRVYHCRYVAGSWVFRVRSLDTVQLDTDTGEQYNIGSQIPLQ